MGYSYSSDDAPEMCFNAAKSWQLRWYQSKHLQVDILNGSAGTVLYEGDLAYFDEDLSDSSVPPMIIKLNTESSTDFYMFFNRKFSFNEGTQEGGNQVMITRQGNEGFGYGESELLAKLTAGDSWTESSTTTIVQVNFIGSRATVKICNTFCNSSPTVSPTESLTVNYSYIEVTSDDCEKFGHETILTESECSKAAFELGRTVTWGPYGGYTDVVTGCSARFTIDSTHLFLNQPGVCDPTTNVDGWGYTGCKCADWMPCLCRISSSPVASPVSQLPTASPTASPTTSPTALPTGSPNASPTASPIASPVASPVESPVASPVASPPTSSSCNDSKLRFRLTWNNKKIARDCTWVANKATNQRCAVDGVTAMCPNTCDACDTCVDSDVRFKVIWNEKKITRDCSWVANRATKQKCAADGVFDSCRSTCEQC